VDAVCGTTRIDGVPIGAAIPSTGAFTSVTANAGITATAGNFTLTAGNLGLPATVVGGTGGVIKFGGSPVIHRYNSATNIFIGDNCGNTAVALTGTGLTGIGYVALQNVTTGSNMVAIGYSALRNATTVVDNVAIGTNAAKAITNSGSNNTAIGREAMASLTSGDNNIAIGYATMQFPTDVNTSVAIGYVSLRNLTAGSSYNVGIGYGTLSNIATGSYNSAFGYNAGSSLTLANASNIDIRNTGTVGDNNITRIGTEGTGAGQQNLCYIAGSIYTSTATAAADRVISTTNTENANAASHAHFQATTGGASGGDPYVNWLVSGAGTFSAGIDNSDSDIWKLTSGATPSAGTACLKVTSAGALTTAAGITATTGNITLTAGNLVLPATTTDPYGTIILGGIRFLSSYGVANTFCGMDSGNTAVTLTGTANTGFGFHALLAITTGEYNCAFGSSAGLSITSGQDNSCIGNLSLTACVDGDYNVAIGTHSLLASVSDDYNTGVGAFSLLLLNGGSGHNTAIGYAALSIVTGSYNIALGDSAGNLLVAAESNNIIIGHLGVVGDNNTTRIGTEGTHTNSYISGNIYTSTAVAAADRVVSTANTENANAASHAHFQATTGGANGGDPYINFLVTGAGTFSMGIDNSDSDNLKITTGATPSAASTVWQMTTAGERVMPLQPSFLAWPDVDQDGVTGDGTIYTVTFATEIWDQNNDFDGTSTFTSPVTGRYFFTYSLYLKDLTTSNYIYMIVITSNRAHPHIFTAATPVSSGGYDIQILDMFCYADMDAGDTAYCSLQVLGGAKIIDVVRSYGTTFGGELSV
jgi:hypothetical protein